jgi:hypothetical protein
MLQSRDGLVNWIKPIQGSVQWLGLMNAMFIKCGYFIDKVSDYQLLKKDSAGWNCL